MSRKDELYHYGVKGMKWGKRKEIREYLDAKKKGALDRSAKANADKRRKENVDFIRFQRKVTGNHSPISYIHKQRSQNALQERREKNKANIRFQRKITGNHSAISFIHKLRRKSKSRQNSN